jgi:hypothetical protein
MTPHRDWDHS